MKITLLQIGNSPQKPVQKLFAEYQKRLGRFAKLEVKMIPDLKNAIALSQKERKEQEGKALLKAIQPTDYIVLLDEQGAQYTSRKWAHKLQQIMNVGPRHLVFVIGGAYGFSEGVYRRAQALWSLSSLTFPHDLVRVIFAEQLYRAFTILHNMPYHHD